VERRTAARLERQLEQQLGSGSQPARGRGAWEQPRGRRHQPGGAAEPRVIKAATLAELDAALEATAYASPYELLRQRAGHQEARGGLAVIYFTAAWCGPCRAFAPKYDELSAAYDDVAFLKVCLDARCPISMFTQRSAIGLRMTERVGYVRPMIGKQMQL
jgi:hypothetical protein